MMWLCFHLNNAFTCLIGLFVSTTKSGEKDKGGESKSKGKGRAFCSEIKSTAVCDSSASFATTTQSPTSPIRKMQI